MLEDLVGLEVELKKLFDYGFNPSSAGWKSSPDSIRQYLATEHHQGNSAELEEKFSRLSGLPSDSSDYYIIGVGTDIVATNLHRSIPLRQAIINTASFVVYSSTDSYLVMDIDRSTGTTMGKVSGYHGSTMPIEKTIRQNALTRTV